MMVLVAAWAAIEAVLDGELEKAIELGAEAEEGAYNMGLPDYARSMSNPGSAALILTGRFQEMQQSQNPVRALIGRALSEQKWPDDDAVQLVRAGGRGNSGIEALYRMLLKEPRAAGVIVEHARLPQPPFSAVLFAGVWRVQGEAHAVLGDWAAARERLEAALEASVAFRHRPEVALCHLDLAEAAAGALPGRARRGDRAPGLRHRRAAGDEDAAGAGAGAAAPRAAEGVAGGPWLTRLAQLPWRGGF